MKKNPCQFFFQLSQISSKMTTDAAERKTKTSLPLVLQRCAETNRLSTEQLALAHSFVYENLDCGLNDTEKKEHFKQFVFVCLRERGSLRPIRSIFHPLRHVLACDAPPLLPVLRVRREFLVRVRRVADALFGRLNDSTASQWPVHPIADAILWSFEQQQGDRLFSRGDSCIFECLSPTKNAHLACLIICEYSKRRLTHCCAQTQKNMSLLKRIEVAWDTGALASLANSNFACRSPACVSTQLTAKRHCTKLCID